jgi:hypothetical protein
MIEQAISKTIGDNILLILGYMIIIIPFNHSEIVSFYLYSNTKLL